MIRDSPWSIRLDYRLLLTRPQQRIGRIVVVVIVVVVVAELLLTFRNSSSGTRVIIIIDNLKWSDDQQEEEEYSRGEMFTPHHTYWENEERMCVRSRRLSRSELNCHSTFDLCKTKSEQSTACLCRRYQKTEIVVASPDSCCLLA